MFTICDIAEREEWLIKNAEELYGEFFTNARDVIQYSWEFTDGIKPEGWVYHTFFSQYNKSMTLALMSVLRLHTNQAEFNIRQALESCVLACYALYKPDDAEFVSTDDEGISQAKSSKSDSKRRYDWLTDHYPYFSEKIKYYKDRINDDFAHSNMINAYTNVTFDFDSGHFNSDFFDNNDEWYVKCLLWKVCNINLGLMELIAQVNKDYPLLKVKLEFEDRIRYFWSINLKQKENIKKDTSFPEGLRSVID